MGWFNRSDDRRSTNLSDEQAVERYRYMLRTAPPEAIEQAHEEAFSKLTPEQRRMALDGLARVVPDGERRSLSDDPRTLARLATRAEIRQPGMLERLFGGRSGYGGGAGAGMMGGGMGMGSMLAGSLLASVAGSFIGSAIAENFFHDHPFESAGFVDGGDGNVLDAPDPDAESSFDESALDSGGFEDGFGDIEI